MTWTFLGIIFMIDQMLLPMSQIGPISFKISYFILLFWFLTWFSRSKAVLLAQTSNKDFYRFVIGWAFFMCVGLVGEVWLTLTQDVPLHSEALRILIFYLFTLFAFGLGNQCRNIDLSWLIRIFYLALFLNLLFIVFKLNLPSWLINFYYPERAFDLFPDAAMSDLESLINLARPRGIFSNPNVSAHMINLIVLFIHLALRNKLFKLKFNVESLGIVVLPIFFSIIFSSRGEFLVSSLFAVLNFKQLYNSVEEGERKSLIYKFVGAFFGVIIFISFVIYSFEEEFHLIENFSRIEMLLNSKSEASENMDPDLKGASRGLMFLQGGNVNRILSSPLFGAGYSEANEFPFNFPTKYCHQDWVYIFMTSGILGFFAIVFLLIRIALPLGWPVLIPWVLPGFVNTFMLIFPAFMFYWFMIAVLKQKKYQVL